MKKKYDNKDLRIAFIGGGSRGWAWVFMSDLALDKDIGGKILLYDIDKEAAIQNARIGNRLSQRPEAVGNWEYVAKDNLAETLTGADFVVISILPGTFTEMQSDVHSPERYGIYQSVGDTVGPGGLVRGLRTIPMFQEIASAVKTYCPQAWVINYTNPMSLCVGTLYKTFPEIKAFGCCHEVFGTQKLLAKMCQELLDNAPVKREDIFVNVLGINHFTWFNYASYQNYDLFPLYSDYVKKHYDTGVIDDEEHWANSSFASAQRVKFDLFHTYGWIAAAGDRHLAEFMPGNVYLKNPQVVKDWKFGLTTVAWRQDDLVKRQQRALRLAGGEEDFTLEPSGEEGIQLIKALCGLGRMISNVNIPNTCRQISNLPAEAVVETNALFQLDMIQPLEAGAITEPILRLIEPHVENQALVLTAGLNRDRQSALKAFENDPLVMGRITKAQAEKLFEEMLEKTKIYLPKDWF